MKFKLLSILSILFFLGNAQDDTLLFNGFSFMAVDSNSYFQLDETNKVNVNYQGWKTRSDMRALANAITDNMGSYIWYDDQTWRNWHVIPYTESIDTLIEDEVVTYDTITNIGLRSFSWFENPNRAATVLMTPPVYLKDNTGKLFWKSMPLQGPRYQDGYKVYILEGGSNTPENVPFQTIEYDFAMKELDVTNSSPLPTITSLFELERDFGFVPEDGSNHVEYTLPDTNELGEMDSTRQHPFMQGFELSLGDYNGYVQIAFVHDSYDNNGIILDDILIKGTGTIGLKEISLGSLNVFPNPVVHELFIEMEDNWINPTVQIFDVNGRLVMVQDVKAMNSIKVGALEPGQYLLKLYTQTGVYTQSFIKSK